MIGAMKSDASPTRRTHYTPKEAVGKSEAMKTISLTQGKEAIVDDDDFERVSKYKWCYDGEGYATANVCGKQTRMHRFILNAQPGQHVDHANMAGLDNRKENIRICNNSQNHANIGLRSDNTTGYKGVSFIKRDNIFQAKIQVHGHHMNLGSFNNPKEAALAYNKAASLYFGEFARLNILEAL